ncbi:uncharacterized protein LOC134238756 [Saccostrea cucullata]|uniref:uncharacterized protein LOC134238756 n=1 Tax=Saccostrea cuccullata TaxID=36930 RepID=UPI002ED3B2A9
MPQRRRKHFSDIESGDCNEGFSNDDDGRSINGSGRAFAVASKILSAVLIITNVVLDWMQYMSMDDSVERNATTNVSSKPNPTKECVDGSEKDELTKKFMYFSIAGSFLALLQIINIIIQIKGKSKKDNKNHGLNGKAEVFFVTILIEIPQNYMLLRYEDICINTCDTGWDLKKIMRFANGLSSVISALWRYITSISLPRSKEWGDSCCCCGSLDNYSSNCGKFCKGCIEDYFFCIFPWLKCLSRKGCWFNIPCCCTIIWKCRKTCNGKSSDCITIEPGCCCTCCCSKEKEPLGDITWKGDGLIVILVSVAPTIIHIIMYTMRIVKYFCGATHMAVFEFLYKNIESYINEAMKWAISRVPTF